MSKSKKHMKPTAIDLFCGCGAVTQGIKDEFDVLAAVDNDPIAAMTYKINHTGVRFFEDDITKLDPRSLKNAVEKRKINLLVVCAPCQPFSTQNNRHCFDERTFLILQAYRYAKVLKPDLIFFENVKGLTSPKHKSIIEKLQNDLKRIGYYAWLGPVEIDAADYNVPQRRRRCIMMCSRNLLPAIPIPITPVGQRICVYDAIGDLKSLASGEKSEDDLHFARKHQPIALKRFRFISKNGGSRFELPKELILKCHIQHNGHPDVYGRMAWNDVAPTLTTGCTDVTRGRFIHPVDDRAITLREAARLQTFPDDFQFYGCPQSIARQIGNAVPVELVKALAIEMSNMFIRIEGVND